MLSSSSLAAMFLILLGACQIPSTIALILKKTNHHQQTPPYHSNIIEEEAPSSSSRRQFLTSAASSTAAAAAVILASATTTSLFPQSSYAALDLPPFQTSKSTGLQWSDARVGSGNPLKVGQTATIDYVLSTTGARYGTKIFATTDKDMPYRWTLGDKTTIQGIEQAILGNNNEDEDDGINPMLPGGIRRVIIPQSLGYTQLASNPKQYCIENGTPGPIPPPSKAFEEYQRFKNIYCNPDRQYQPDIVLDIKLYGARSVR